MPEEAETLSSAVQPSVDPPGAPSSRYTQAAPWKQEDDVRFSTIVQLVP